jgi:hypothetical protein
VNQGGAVESRRSIVVSPMRLNRCHRGGWGNLRFFAPETNEEMK